MGAVVAPHKLLLAAATGAAALVLGTGAVTSTAHAYAGPAAASSQPVSCAGWVSEGAAHLSLLTDAVPVDVGAKVCGLLDALQGVGGGLG